MFGKVFVVLLIGLFTVTHIVMAEDNTADSSVDLGQIVVTPLGFEEDEVNYPGYVSVMTRADIERSNADYVYDLLRKEPGIFVRDLTGSGKEVSVDMRGFGETASSNVLILMDGRCVNEIDMSNTDWAQIPIEYVERVEVLRGGGSVLYGDNAVAGVINIITRKGKGKSTIKLGYEGGDYRYNNYNVAAQGEHDFAKYSVFFKHNKTDGYRVNGDYDGYDFDGNITMTPTDYFSVNIATGYHKDWYGLPGGLTAAEISQVGRRGSTNPRDRSKTENTYVKITPKTEFNLAGADNSLDIDFWMSKRRVDTDWVSMGSQYWSQIDTIAGTVRYINQLDLESIDNRFIAGMDLLQAENKINSTTPYQSKVTKKTLGIYVSDVLTVHEGFIITGGIRQEWSKYNFHNVLTGRNQSKSPSQDAYDLGIEYKYREAGGVYARCSRSFRFPKTDEFYSVFAGTIDTDLKQQVADTVELGIKDYGCKYLQGNVNFFFMEVDNEIYYDPVTFSNDNYDEIHREGLEIAVRSDIHEMLDLFFGYTWTNAYFTKGSYASNKVPMVPENKISFHIAFIPFEWLEFNFESDYVGKQRAISDQAAGAPLLKGYFVSNGKVTAKYKGWKVFFGVNNIFDETYSEYASWASWQSANDYFPAPERNYIFGASVVF